MQPGYNHNIKYKGKVYHVQTEDSGKDNPTIITHIFFGGNILATKRSSYQDIAQNENADKIIQEMMQEQHKALIKELIAGKHDARLNAQAQPPPQKIDLATPTLDADQVGKKDEKSLDDIILDYLSKEKS
jgi:peroxiredoxin family protein